MSIKIMIIIIINCEKWSELYRSFFKHTVSVPPHRLNVYIFYEYQYLFLAFWHNRVWLKIDLVYCGNNAYMGRDRLEVVRADEKLQCLVNLCNPHTRTRTCTRDRNWTHITILKPLPAIPTIYRALYNGLIMIICNSTFFYHHWSCDKNIQFYHRCR